MVAVAAVVVAVVDYCDASVADEDNVAGHAAVAVGRAADGEDGSCRDPSLNTAQEGSWKDSLETSKKEKWIT